MKPLPLQVQVQIDSPNMELPNKDMRVHIDPVQVVVDSGPLTNGLLQLLSVKEKGFSEGQSVQVVGSFNTRVLLFLVYFRHRGR